MAIDPHVFDPVPMMTFTIKPPLEVCRVCGKDERLCALTYKPRGADDG